MSVPAVLAQTGGLGNPLAVLLFPILLGILVGGPLLALAGIVLAIWRRRSPAWGARIPRWLGLYAFAANTAFIAYMLATTEFPAGAVFEWPARTAMVLGLLAMTLGVRPLLASWVEGTPASIAWANGDTELLGHLRGAGARDADTHEPRFRSLVDAVRSGDLATVRALHAAGVRWTHAGAGGMDVPIAAGEEGRTEVLRLFTSGSSYKCADTDAALLAAARRARQETVAFLLTTCLTFQGVDAATVAAEEAGHLEIGRLFRARPSTDAFTRRGRARRLRPEQAG